MVFLKNLLMRLKICHLFWTSCTFSFISNLCENCECLLCKIICSHSRQNYSSLCFCISFYFVIFITCSLCISVFFFFNIIDGHTGSSVQALLYCGKWSLLSSFGALASHWSGFSLQSMGPRTLKTSVVAACGLSGCGSRAQAQ